VNNFDRITEPILVSLHISLQSASTPAPTSAPTSASTSATSAPTSAPTLAPTLAPTPEFVAVRRTAHEPAPTLCAPALLSESLNFQLHPSTLFRPASETSLHLLCLLHATLTNPAHVIRWRVQLSNGGEVTSWARRYLESEQVRKQLSSNIDCELLVVKGFLFALHPTFLYSSTE
jgi:hypothetical protein